MKWICINGAYNLPRTISIGNNNLSLTLQMELAVCLYLCVKRAHSLPLTATLMDGMPVSYTATLSTVWWPNQL